jgi:mono/diheme cytochrome c family protein
MFIGGASAQVGKKSIWDGVYTSDQANRGQEIYDKRCTECHQDDLSGGGDEAAPVLRGADFFARWNDKTVADLFQKISGSMPRTAPGTLSPSATNELIAFILKKNQIPASDAPLPVESAKLQQIVITDQPR